MISEMLINRRESCEVSEKFINSDALLDILCSCIIWNRVFIRDLTIPCGVEVSHSHRHLFLF